MSNLSKRGYIGATNYRDLNFTKAAVIRCDYASCNMFTKGDFYVGFKTTDGEHLRNWWVADDNRHLRCITPDDTHCSFGSFSLHGITENDLPPLSMWGDDELVDPIRDKFNDFSTPLLTNTSS